MIYKAFKDIELSRLGMGNMRLPVDSSKPGSPIDQKSAKEMIDYAMCQGINYYDTAYVYHNGASESFLGEALSEYPRERYYLATKFFILANPDYKAVFEEQLNRLQTDYIDFYLIHGIFDHTYQQYIDCGCIDYFLEQQRKGEIHHLGFSSHAKPENLKKFATHHQWDFAQLQINYFDWNYRTAKEEYEMITELNIPIMVMESIRGGRLSSLNTAADKMLLEKEPQKSISSWALRFLMTLPNVQVILSGMSTMEQLQDNIETFKEEYSLNDEDMQLLMNACEVFHDEVVVPCTACRYCCDGCPKHINIPQVLAFYNKLRTDGARGIKQEISKIEAGKRPADCIACGACTEHCPQNIQIPDIMKEFERVLKDL